MYYRSKKFKGSILQRSIKLFNDEETTPLFDIDKV